MDKNIPYIHKLFSFCNDIQLCEGRLITSKDLKDVDVLIVRSVTEVNQELLHNSVVKFVGTVTSGIDHIDQNFLRTHDIGFSAAPGSNAIAVVEYVLTALFSLAQRNGFFLRDKIVGIVGVGHIGSLLYRRLYEFGVNILLCDPPLSKKCMKYNWKSLEELVSEVDILTLHTPLTDDQYYPTRHMINFDVLDALPSNTILINTARGAVIDNHALLKIFKNGKKLNIVLDVWEEEPILSIPLLSYVNIGTAHIAGYTLESKVRSIFHIYNEYCKFFDIFNDKKCENLPVFSRIHHIKINSTIDEWCIYELVKYIYNIRYDDMILRRMIVKPEGFDKIRKNYVDRREWSSFFIQAYQKENYQMLINLGFNINNI